MNDHKMQLFALSINFSNVLNNNFLLGTTSRHLQQISICFHVMKQ